MRVSYLARLLDVLEYALDQEGPVTLGALATGAGVPVSTASRLVSLLTERGYLQRTDAGAFLPGAHLLHLGLRTVARVRGTPRFEMATRTIAQATGESASVGLLVGAEIVLVARHEPGHALRVVARVGDIIAPHTSAMGKAILAHLPRARRLAVLAAAIGTDKAEAQLADLAADIDAVIGQGYACDEEQYAVGQRCRAVVLRAPDGDVVGGVSVAGPAARFTLDAAARSIEILRDQAERLGRVSDAGLGVT